MYNIKSLKHPIRNINFQQYGQQTEIDQQNGSPSKRDGQGEGDRSGQQNERLERERSAGRGRNAEAASRLGSYRQVREDGRRNDMPGRKEVKKRKPMKKVTPRQCICRSTVKPKMVKYQQKEMKLSLLTQVSPTYNRKPVKMRPLVIE